jgi:hypothetical protein
MKPPDCRVLKKNKQSKTFKRNSKQKTPKKAKTVKNVHFAESPKQIVEMAAEERVEEAVSQQTAARKLSKFFKTSSVKRRVKFLNTVCSNSNICITFGKEIKKINEFFDGFTSFKYMNGPAVRIGTVSANGFVKLIQYSREGYNSSAVLKSSVRARSDNLYYEYIVGNFLNQFISKLPCFLETYGVFIYPDDADWLSCKDNKDTPKSVYENLALIDNPNYLSSSCKYSKYIALLIQSVPDAVSLGDMLASSNKKRKEFIEADLAGALFQVYMPLAVLSDRFTHYDLHIYNVLLYSLGMDTYVQYHYITKKGTVSFKSNYVVKIIDYGRSYFYYDKHDNSRIIYDEICRKKDCDPNCGEDYGYTLLEPTTDFYYISSSLNNVSHDLRLLNMIKPAIKTGPIYDSVIRKLKYKGNFGTKENKKQGYPKSINNVIDVFSALVDIMKDPAQIQINEAAYAGKKQIGVLTVYEDGRPMEYVVS